MAEMRVPNSDFSGDVEGPRRFLTKKWLCTRERTVNYVMLLIGVVIFIVTYTPYNPPVFKNLIKAPYIGIPVGNQTSTAPRKCGCSRRSTSSARTKR